MFFPLRAALVIGGLTYLALLKDRPDDAPALPTAPSLRAAAQQVSSLQVSSLQVSNLPVSSLQALPVQSLTAAWDAMAPEVRERIAREGADVFARHLAAQPAASADTLGDADRRPAWRGVGAR